MADSHPLWAYRKSRGLTQEALGKELGVTGQTVWRWENGSRSPRRRDLSRIAEKTGLSPAELLGFGEKLEAAQ